MGEVDVKVAGSDNVKAGISDHARPTEEVLWRVPDMAPAGNVTLLKVVCAINRLLYTL